MSVIVQAVDWSGINWQVDEPRPELEYGRSYPVLGLHCCTECKKQGRHEPRHDIKVTKHYWANRPLGQLCSRCPEHQAYWEANPTRDRAPRDADISPELRQQHEPPGPGTGRVLPGHACLLAAADRVTLMPDDCRDDQYMMGMWDMHMPAFRRTENPAEWMAEWVSATLIQVENTETPQEYCEQIVCGPFLLWNDSRCDSTSGAESNTMAPLLMRNLGGQRAPGIEPYGPIVVTGMAQQRDWTPIPPAPLTPQMMNHLFLENERVNALLSVMHR